MFELSIIHFIIFTISDTIRFLDDTITVLRHVPGENAVLLVKYEQPPSHLLPLEFTW